MATVPVVLLPVKMRLPLPDVGKRTKKIQTPVPADPEILPQTSIRFIKLPRRKPKPSVKLGGTLFYLVIQWICVALMALSTLRMAQNFWANRVTLGSIAGVVQEKNYAQGIYLIGALICVGFGCIQALWIASRKRMPDHGKIRQVDMGRGLFGFVVLVLLAFISTYAYPILPASPAPLEGAKLFFHIVDDLGKSFLFMNVIGAILCVVRKMGTR